MGENKTARFKAIVEKCGNPRTVTLWTAPRKNRDFMKALKEARIMTVIRQNVGTKKDQGVVGFEPQAGAIFLVFPRSLKEFAGRKVVGIDLGLVREPEADDPVPPRSNRTKPRSTTTAHKAPQPAPQRTRKFEVALEFAAKYTHTATIEATSPLEAKTRALQEIEPDWSKAEVRKVAKVRANRH